jgi:hypothetical protein
MKLTPSIVRQIVRQVIKPRSFHFPTRNLVSSHSADRAERRHQMLDFFEGRMQGRGIWKWRQYFDAYEQHLNSFIDREVHIVEVGVYSGGSLDMWRSYFGSRCHIYGVDIEPACKAYEQAGTKVFIGDQADRAFWADFRRQVPKVDILIDDGGHKPHQQITTLQEMLPHLSQ